IKHLAVSGLSSGTARDKSSCNLIGENTMNHFKASNKIINTILSKMKNERYISEKAVFNDNAFEDLRTEVTYRDADFLNFLGKTELEEEFIDELVMYLVNSGITNLSSGYNKNAFMEFRKEVKSVFSGTWTSITPVMERILYVLTSIKRPDILVEFGSFWGNTLAWFAGPFIGKMQQYCAKEIIGVDVDTNMCKMAIENFTKIENTQNINIINGDARNIISQNEGPIDFLYLEAKTDEEPDLYKELLELVYDKLSRDAWIIAHDIFDKDQIHHFKNYLNFVKNSNYFSKSISLDVDFCGMELTIK
ncbi:MAG: class I SAM-dependent methyltransferase, partial [Spirochaetales bacterium]|nr:class I SAM-dependent methyltransferase [Spirochaetales bacterium]